MTNRKADGGAALPACGVVVRGLTLPRCKPRVLPVFQFMPAALPYSKHTPGRTFIIAISVLGLIALMQVGMLGWAFVKRVRAGTQLVAVPPPMSPLPKPSPAPITEKDLLTLVDPFEDKESALTLENSTEPIMPPSRPRPVPMPRLQLAPDSRLSEMLQQARTFRDRGDMSSALTRFRDAYALDTRNPEAIAEIAVTYEKLGLPDKAAEHWKRVYDMGESAGVYFSAAQAKMKEAVMATRGVVERPAEAGVQGVQAGGGTAPSATFGIGAIESEEIRDPKATQRLVVKVPIEQRIKTKINVKELSIHVLFYDLLDDKPQRTTANVSSRWRTAPVDWREDESEVLEVDYNRPLPDVREAKRESRKYYGYIVRVYYKEELQATRSEPPVLGQKFPASQTLEKEATP